MRKFATALLLAPMLFATYLCHAFLMGNNDVEFIYKEVVGLGISKFSLILMGRNQVLLYLSVLAMR
jgi:hypothetical protein